MNNKYNENLLVLIDCAKGQRDIIKRTNRDPIAIEYVKKLEKSIQYMETYNNLEKEVDMV